MPRRCRRRRGKDGRQKATAFSSQQRSGQGRVDSKIDPNIESKVYEVLVVGAGPSSLACVSSLLEPHVQSTLSYDHDRDMLNRGRGRSTRACGRSRVLRQQDICIVDENAASWMTRWKSQFKLLKIPRLRSLMIHHPDPFSDDSLLEYAILEKRMNLKDCGEPVEHFFEEGSSRRERKKSGARAVSRIRLVNNADRFKYIRPHTNLYHQFCDRIVEKYRLDDRVVKGTVVDVEPVSTPTPCSTEAQKSPLLKVRLRDGTTIMAKNVVLAVGNTCVPRIPVWAEENRCKTGSTAPSRCEHVWELAKKGPACLPKTVRKKRVLVIGGGLTAVQSTQMCMREGARSVVLMARRHITIRDFAVPVSWFGSTKNAEMCKFLQTEDPEQRFDQVRDVRGPATVPRLVFKEFQEDLRRHRSASVMEGYEVLGAEWDEKKQTYDVTFRNLNDAESKSTGSVTVDYILLATGAESSWKLHPLLRSIAGHVKPVGDVGGLPVLTEDLRWQADLNIFVTGGYAALQLGPAAATLAGARKGASLLRDAILRSRQEPPNKKWASTGHVLQEANAKERQAQFLGA